MEIELLGHQSETRTHRLESAWSPSLKKKKKKGRPGALETEEDGLAMDSPDRWPPAIGCITTWKETVAGLPVLATVVDAGYRTQLQPFDSIGLGTDRLGAMSM